MVLNVKHTVDADRLLQEGDYPQKAQKYWTPSSESPWRQETVSCIVSLADPEDLRTSAGGVHAFHRQAGAARGLDDSPIRNSEVND